MAVPAWRLGLMVWCAGWCGTCNLAVAASGSSESGPRYRNSEYLFSVEAPPGLLCESDPPPSPNHGCRIKLDEASQAAISVVGEYNALDRVSPRDELDARAGGSLKPGLSLTVLRREATTLGGLEAERLSLGIADREGSTPRVRDWVVAFRAAQARGEIIYTAGLETSKERYPQDQAVFERVLASWRLEEPPADR